MKKNSYNTMSWETNRRAGSIIGISTSKHCGKWLSRRPESWAWSLLMPSSDAQWSAHVT